MQVAARLQGELDLAQPLVRFGGDEFAVLAELDDEREAAALAQRLHDLARGSRSATSSSAAAIGIAVEDPQTRRHRPRPGRRRRHAPRQGPRRRRLRGLRPRDGRPAARPAEDRGRPAPRARARRAAAALPADRATSRRAGPSPSRRSCAGSTPRRACSARAASCPPPSSTARLISAIGVWVLRQACLRGRPLAGRACASASTSPRASWASRASWSGSSTRSPPPGRARADRAGDHRDDADGGRRGRDRRARGARGATACRSTSTTSAPATRR